MAFFRWRKRAGISAQLGRGAHVIRWVLRLAMIALVADLFYLAVIWPDWKALASGPVPKSSFMHDYELKRAQNHGMPRLRWRPVPLSAIPRHMLRAVILAEDSRFYEHSGFDLIAFKEAMTYNWEEGEFIMGASTISQQTVKNLFLSPARTPWRKWHELILTWGMEQNLSKRRIMELYLNVAEFGPGIYGVGAAAEEYYSTSAATISLMQAAELAASLPGPNRHNPGTRTAYFQRRAQKIMNFLLRHPGDVAEAVGQYLVAHPPEPAPTDPTPDAATSDDQNAPDTPDTI